ncbi:MAG: tetratricopeptide repeat protein [Gemmatimonadetes bacterium]|nr:tetratricopeptide repeat protein [Gemmatimonadota bacterium]
MHIRTIAFAAATALVLAAPARAQTYDPASGTSPLTLTAVPGDGVAYFQARERARALFEQQKWGDAIPILRQLVRDYPRDPENWMMLGLSARALNRWDEAFDAFQHAGPLAGWDLPVWNGYRMAGMKMAMGDRRGALDLLRWMIVERHGFLRMDEWDEPRFAPLRGDPEFRALVGHPDTAGWTRDEGWRHDIDLLHEETKRVNPDYRDRPFPAELERRYEQLKRDVPRLSDEEIFVGMNRMLAVLHQGHIALWSPPHDRFLPLRLYSFPEGVYVIEADPAYRALAGSRVLAFGATPAEEVLRRMNASVPIDGDMQYLWGTSTLAETAWLKGLGAIDRTDSVRLTLRMPDGAARTVMVATRDSAREGRQDRLVAPPGVPAPLFLGHLRETFWHTAVPAHDAVYVQVNNLVDAPDETLAAYGRRLWTVLDTTRAANLILDIRHNNGGSTQLYPELLRSLIAYSRVPGRQVWVLIGRRTYSAAGNFVTDLERLTDPVFVGEASSECCNLYGDPAALRLPWSGVQGELTAVKWQLSQPGDARREMSPEVPVQLTAAAYFAGQDPALDAIYRLIAARKATSSTP